MKKVLTTLFVITLLAGCAVTPPNVTVTTQAVHRQTLNIVVPKPLALSQVHFKIVIDPTTHKPQYVLDGDDFTNLAQNMERIQDRLELDEKTIQAQKHYAANLNK